MQVEVLGGDRANGMGRLEAAWRELQRAGGVSHPMYTWEWMSTWWQVFGEGRSLVALVARDEHGVAAIAPFVRRKARMNRLFSFDRLELMGTGEDESGEVFSEYVDMPVRPGAGKEVGTRLADQILDFDGEHRWEDIVLHRVGPASAAYSALRDSADRKGFPTGLLEQGECPYVALPATIGQYERQLGPKRRYQIRRSLRDLEKVGRIRFEKAETLDSALCALSVLGELHQQRWEARGKPGVFSSQSFEEFHRQFIRRTFALGWPELWTLCLDGQPIACRYNLRYQGRISCYLSGTKALETHRAQPGIVAHYLCIKDAIESGATEYDFMLGRQSYKLSLSNATRELVTLRVSRNSPKEYVRRNLTAFVRWGRRLLSRRRGGRRT